MPEQHRCHNAIAASTAAATSSPDAAAVQPRSPSRPPSSHLDVTIKSTPPASSPCSAVVSSTHLPGFTLTREIAPCHRNFKITLFQELASVLSQTRHHGINPISKKGMGTNQHSPSAPAFYQTYSIHHRLHPSVFSQVSDLNSTSLQGRLSSPFYERSSSRPNA